MMVRFRKLDAIDRSTHEGFYIAPTQIFLAPDKHYEVHALSVYDGVCFLLVVDDVGTPMFKPRALFDVLDPTLPEDWICNTFPSGPVQLVIGPSFVAKDLASYNDMVDQRIAQVTAFWQRADSRKATRTDLTVTRKE